MRTIPLSRGLVAFVDDADFEEVSKFKWHVAEKGRNLYAARNLTAEEAGCKRKQLLLHQFIMGCTRIDHRDGDGLNNQRGNLRRATKSQNAMARQKKAAGATSGFRGVSWATTRGKWKAQIKVAGTTIVLGRFLDETQAAKAYDEAAKKYFGEFAAPNFL